MPADAIQGGLCIQAQVLPLRKGFRQAGARF